MLWTVASTRTTGLAVGRVGAATIEGRPSEPPAPPRRRLSDRETPFCRRRRHQSQHASKHSNTTPAARLPASQRTPASIQASPLDTWLPSPSPDGSGGAGGGGGGNKEGGSEGGGIGGKIGRCCTLIIRVSPASFRSAEIVARTWSTARLPSRSALASSAPPCFVTESRTSTPLKEVVVTATPLLPRLGISAARLPVVSKRNNTAWLICSARPRLDTTGRASLQSGELIRHAASNLVA